MLPAALLLLAQLQSSPQQPAPPFRAEVNLVGRIEGTCVTPSGDIWFVTSAGHAYRSRDRGELWSDVSLPLPKSTDEDSSYDHLQQVGFFDAQHGVISGHFRAPSNQVLVTDDGGTTWNPALLLEDIWTYDSALGPGASGWLVGSTGAVLHTTDFGKTWSVWSRFENALRSAAICARDENSVIVASIEGVLRFTEDHGAHWKFLEPPGAKVKKLLLDGRRLVCVTENWIKCCDDFASGQWRNLGLDSEPCVCVARHPDGMLFQLRSWGVALANPRLELLRRWPGRLEETAVSLACNKDLAVALLDPEGRYEIIDDKGIRSMRMLSANSTPVWPMADIDRAATGPMFGISKWGLYESTDEGKTWERVHSLQDPQTIRALEDGSGAFVRSDEKSWLWSSKEKSITPIPALDVFNSGWLEIIRRGPMWLAIGSRHDEDETTLRMLRTSDTIRYGPGFESLVYGSADGGRTWSEILRLPRHTVAVCYFGDDGVLSLLLTGAEVARLPIAIQPSEGGAPSAVRLSGQVVSQPIRPMPHWGCWLEFVDGNHGELGGNTFFEGPIIHRTPDGGKTWTPLPQPKHGMAEDLVFLRLGGGSWLRGSIPYKQTSQVAVWKGAEYQVLRTFEAGIHDAHVDAAGRALFRLNDGAMWELSSDGSQWRDLPNTPIPGR